MHGLTPPLTPPLIIKEKLVGLAAPTGRSFTVRIVCQELESWFNGDPEAVHRAFPGCLFSSQTAKYRDPDRLTNAADELTSLTGSASKVDRAGKIAAHLEPASNASRSFHHAYEILASHLG